MNGGHDLVVCHGLGPIDPEPEQGELYFTVSGNGGYLP